MKFIFREVCNFYLFFVHISLIWKGKALNFLEVKPLKLIKLAIDIIQNSIIHYSHFNKQQRRISIPKLQFNNFPYFIINWSPGSIIYIFYSWGELFFHRHYSIWIYCSDLILIADRYISSNILSYRIIQEKQQ